MTKDDLAELAAIINERSFGRGNITLASGKESSFYFDMKPTMLHPKGAELLTRALLACVIKADAQFVGSPEMGAVPLISSICCHSQALGTPLHGFFVRKQPKGHGAQKLVEGLPKGETLAGKDIAIIEDVTTTGASAWKAAEACLAEGANIKVIITIVDREDGADEFFKAKGVPFVAIFKASRFLQ